MKGGNGSKEEAATPFLAFSRVSYIYVYIQIYIFIHKYTHIQAYYTFVIHICIYTPTYINIWSDMWCICFPISPGHRTLSQYLLSSNENQIAFINSAISEAHKEFPNTSPTDFSPTTDHGFNWGESHIGM